MVMGSPLSFVLRMAAGVLAVLAIAVGCPEAWSAEIPEASVTGGVAAPPRARRAFDPTPVPGAAQPKALDDGSAGGGATAPPRHRDRARPSCRAPRDAPREPAPVAPLANARSSTRAGPRCSRPGRRRPRRPALRRTLNVDIRIFSPGDNGDVIQLTGTSGGGAGGPGGPAVGSDWDWDWDWTCGPGQRPAGHGCGLEVGLGLGLRGAGRSTGRPGRRRAPCGGHPRPPRPAPHRASMHPTRRAARRWSAGVRRPSPAQSRPAATAAVRPSRRIARREPWAWRLRTPFP